MAVPKKRHSKSRSATRRSSKKVAVRTIGRCSQCNEPKLSHAVCPHCGAYGGRTAVVKEEVES